MSVKSLSRIITFVLFAFLLFFTASFAQTPPFKGEVNSQNINIRSDSTVNSEIICQLDKGAKVEVMSEFYEWYKIRLPHEAPCYVRKDLLKCLNYENNSYPGSATPILNKKVCLSAVATKERINLRLKPDESSPVIGRLDKNEVVNISKSTGHWYKIEPIQNSFGWINKKFVNKASIKNTTFDTKPLKSERTSEENIVVEGIVRPYGKFFNRLASHKLIAQDNEIFLLKGNKQALNGLNNRKVKIIGRKTDLPGQKLPVIEVAVTEVKN